MQDTPDKDLVSRSQGGSQEDFAQLYNRYKARIFNYLYGYLGNFYDAQDLTQEVFISAYNNISSLKDADSFSSWLYMIATNLAKNHILRNKRKGDRSLDAVIGPDSDTELGEIIPDLKTGPDKELDKEILQQSIQDTLDRLPTIYREILLLCDVEGLSYEEASKILNCKVGTIGSRLSEARNKFREIFKARNGADNNEMR